MQLSDKFHNIHWKNLITAVAFYRISRPAAWLMLPYLAWVAFAGYLNLGVWWLNR